MNASHSTCMSPNTFRRILAAHGRSTSPGLFQASASFRPETIMKEIKEKRKKQREVAAKSGEGDNAERAGAQGKKPQMLDSEHIVAKYVVENMWPPRNAVVNPPLSKMRSTKPKLANSYSFYKRPFKVHGKDAWEFAMRDLGSVDTLLNRYGYVEPQWRGDLHPTPQEQKQIDIVNGKSKDALEHNPPPAVIE